jgi:hypothetical protein
MTTITPASGIRARLIGEDREAERPSQDRDPAEPETGVPGLR